MTCKEIRIHKSEEAKNQDKSSIYGYIDVDSYAIFFFKLYDP